jgi:NADP-dependent 3-hydroxy acid dehydrogenase YdfG
MTGIHNQTVAITGATGDMGRTIATLLAREGAKLAIAGRDPQKVASLAQELAKLGVESVSSVVDVTEEDQVAKFFVKAKNAFGRLDALINVPGLSIPGPIAATELGDFERMFDVNVKGAFLSAKHFVSQVDEVSGGLIVNIGSMAAKRANPNAPLYCAAKAALAMMAEGLALQLTAKNIRVTTISPGAADSQFWGSRPVPREKFLKVEDVAEMVHFILRLPKRLVIHDIAFESFEFLRSK